MRVYLIADSDQRYKIGYTGRNVIHRLEELQTASPSRLEVIYEYETKEAPKIEQILHRYYAGKWLSGEWFALSPTEVLGFLNTCSMIERNMNVSFDDDDVLFKRRTS